MGELKCAFVLLCLLAMMHVGDVGVHAPPSSPDHASAARKSNPVRTVYFPTDWDYFFVSRCTGRDFFTLDWYFSSPPWLGST